MSYSETTQLFIGEGDVGYKHDEFIFWRLSEVFIPANFKPISASEKMSMFLNIHLIMKVAER